MANRLLKNRDELEALFGELAQELSQMGISAEIVMVGGAWMLWHSHRLSTRDVDSARKFDLGLRQAVDRVGTRHELPERWLNDDAAPFWPSTASFDDCELIYETPSLCVRSPDPNVIFVMKLYRADPQDREDLVVLWPLCDFSDADDAANTFRLAYPHAPEDEYLADYIADVAHDALP